LSTRPLNLQAQIPELLSFCPLSGALHLIQTIQKGGGPVVKLSLPPLVAITRNIIGGGKGSPQTTVAITVGISHLLIYELSLLYALLSAVTCKLILDGPGGPKHVGD